MTRKDAQATLWLCGTNCPLSMRNQKPARKQKRRRRERREGGREGGREEKEGEKEGEKERQADRQTGRQVGTNMRPLTHTSDHKQWLLWLWWLPRSWHCNGWLLLLQICAHIRLGFPSPFRPRRRAALSLSLSLAVNATLSNTLSTTFAWR